MKIATYTLHRFDSNAEAHTLLVTQLAAGLDASWSPFEDAKVSRSDGSPRLCDVLIREEARAAADSVAENEAR